MLSRQFREIARSRIEALLASFPKLADSGTQHTTVEQDNVRFVYQPLDELYIVLITNKQSNILQDIDSLHIFAQVVTSICKSLDEREILRNAFELLSAFDEVVTLGYRENLTLSQIKTFLEMESHDERISEIIERVGLSTSVDFLTTSSDVGFRTKNSKRARRGRGRRGNLKCNGKRRRGWAKEWLHVHHRIRSTASLSGQLFRIPSILTKLKRKRHLPSRPLPYFELIRLF